MRGRRSRSACAAWLLAILWLTAGPRARAQDFFRVSPGPLSEGHAEWDSAENCGACHKLGAGVTDVLCLECHHHKPLRDAIARGDGLHAGFKKKCVTCHTEHKGREHNINNWTQVGGRTRFDHKQTQFALEGRHAEVSCAACHRRRLKSGRLSYPGLNPACSSCHRAVHAFGEKSPVQDCKLCHEGFRAARGMTAATAQRFDHREQARVALTGKHAKARCVKCHAGGKMAHREPARTCINCHRSPHGQRFVQKACTDCHSPSLRWKQTKVDHDKTTFPLRGEHEDLACGKCHKTPKFKPDTACASCHASVHKKRFDPRPCESCHEKPGFREVRFDHASQARFALLGKHASTRCRDCHRGKKPDAYEKHDDHVCTSCHRHAKAHANQYPPTECARCHVEAGVRTAPFDHGKDARFLLTDFHAQLVQQRTPRAVKKACAKCHVDGTLRTNKLRCADCHKDSHQQQLGDDCARCHRTSVRFKETVYDHATNPRFKREGLHAKVECAKCHVERRYRLGEDLRCARCHAAKDPHQGKLGQACERCHEPVKGAPRFDHNTMTRFVRTGAHARAACSACHRPPPADGKAPAVGWTQGVPVTPVDKRFPVMGRDCAQCHRDPHEGRFGDRCQSCHQPTRFKDATRAIHDTGPTRLQGRHDELPCARCHASEVSLAGLGDRCAFCHVDDDVHRNGLGEDCGRCHGQVDWTPARFSHGETGTVLRGAHRVARCESCHVAGQYQGLATDCEACHLEQARLVREPLHGAEFTRCDDCHSQIAFAPARVRHLLYPLRGAHRGASCRDCHDGQYAGTPDRCEDCHLARYNDPSTRPDHRAAGFSTRCEDCHSPLAWETARYQHQGFVMRGQHRVLACASCHLGEDYGTAIGGQGWVCQACHGPAAPVDAWPPEHGQRGYPLDCELCHSEQAWLPARQAP